MFRALNKKTGALVWVYDTKRDGTALNFHGNAAVSRDLILTGTDDRRSQGRGFVYAFERASGKPRWKFAAGNGVVTDILIDGPQVYAVTLADELVCLDLETGRQKWKLSTGIPNDDFLVNSSPALSEGRVFFAGMNGTVYALDETSGRVLWKRELGLRVSTSTTVAGNHLYVGTIAAHLYMLAADTGALLGDYPLDGRADGSLTVAEGSILVQLGNEAIMDIDGDLRNQRWFKKAPQEWTTARPYVLQGEVLLADHGELFAYRLTDGKEMWSRDFGNIVRGIGTDKEVLYVGTLKGIVYACRSPSAEAVPVARR